MSRRAKQILAAEARKAADGDSFVPVLLLSELDVSKCTQIQFLEILTNLDELCASRLVDQRATYVEQIYNRMLQLLSQKIEIPLNRIMAIVKQLIVYHPVMAILTLDDLKKIGVEMEKRSVIIHFDMSGSMDVRGFNPLVQTVINLCRKLQNQGIQVHISLFGGGQQERIHTAIGGQLLALDQFANGNYRPNGGTAFCPSFDRTKQFPTPYDAIIVSDGDFTDDISRLAFQEQCQTVFFVAPPWSPLGIEEKHAKTISSSVHPIVPYIGIASEKYPQLDTIIEGFLREHNFFACLSGYVTIGTYAIPSNLLAPTQMIQILNNCLAQGEIQLQILTKKILGLFRYLEETAKLNFERCIRGEEFRNLMSLVTPLIKSTQAHLETSNACQQLYGYLTKILNNFAHEQQKLIKSIANDPKAKTELTKFWDDAMSFSERALIIEENERKYGPSVAYLNVRVASLTCTSEILSEALQQLKTLYSPEDFDLLSIILDILSMSKIDDQPTSVPEDLCILIWRKPNGTIDLLSILRQLPYCLQQYQYSRQIPLDNVWTLQPLAAIRLAWIMDASGRTFPDFITQALPSLVVPNKFLTDLDQDENRSAFWMKILRELAPKIDLPSESLQSIHQILTVHTLKGFLLRLTDGSITYEKQVYENVLPFIDTDEPMAWCVFVNKDLDRVDARTGQVIEQSTFITDPIEIEGWYRTNLAKRGSVVRPRYLSLREYSNFPDGAIELYNTCTRKDVDILRDQLTELGGNSYSSDQINSHIYTIRDRLKTIPCVVWGSTDLITETIVMAKAACQGATVPTEKVTINITRAIVIDYLVSHCEDRFAAGALRGFGEYARIASQQASAGTTELDYAIECGQKATTETTSLQIVPFIHLDKPGVREYLEQQYKKLARQLRLVLSPPQFQSLPALLQKAKQTVANDEILGMADLESLPARTTIAKPVESSSQVVLNKDLFTCPITLDIMDNPATTTPCGHMFDMDAINGYLKTANICPICRTVVTGVTQNYAFKNVIEAWLAQQTE
ncbi:unnamed protein product [Rotaria sordida]|uniref:RING-type domain-containing protein n=1 Tax=Rotaria sordida TaxID=392033 RepID=A0A818N7I5_9BILA|nr:unnamed protein product [Rotaria sordida]CAF3600448.1 unnamed protein product [Rotaria sordida]